MISGHALASAAVLALLAGFAAAADAPLQMDPAQVVTGDEPVDAKSAYVLFEAHVVSHGRALEQFYGLLTRVGDDTRHLLLSAPADTSTLVRIPPGQYYVWRVAMTTKGAYSLEKEETLFEAKAGQLNYAGDWTITAERRDIMQGAWAIGSRDSASAWVGNTGRDAQVLAAHPQLAQQLKSVYTRIETQRFHGGDI